MSLQVTIIVTVLCCRIVSEVKDRYRPDAVVLQCGADCLTGDPVGNFNLTPSALGYCVRNVLSWKIPTLVLGGGWYMKLLMNIICLMRIITLNQLGLAATLAVINM